MLIHPYKLQPFHGPKQVQLVIYSHGQTGIDLVADKFWHCRRPCHKSHVLPVNICKSWINLSTFVIIVLWQPWQCSKHPLFRWLGPPDPPGFRDISTFQQATLSEQGRAFLVVMGLGTTDLSVCDCTQFAIAHLRNSSLLLSNPCPATRLCLALTV